MNIFNSLRARVELYTVLSVLITTAILIAVFFYELKQSEKHLLDAMAGKQESISATVLDKVQSQMEKNVSAFTRDKKLFAAIEAKDTAKIADLLSPTANRLEATNTASNLRLIGLDGTVLFTRDSNDPSNLSLSIAKKAVNDMMIEKALEGVNGRPEVHFAFPLTVKGRAVAVIDLAMDYSQLAASKAKIGNYEFMLFDMQGNLISNNNEAVETAFMAEGFDVTSYELNQMSFNEKEYTVVSQPMVDTFGQKIGFVVTMTDDTEKYAAQSMATLIGVLAIVLWIVIAFIFTKIQFIRVFKPLETMEQVVNNISTNGDFSKRIPVHSKDEVGQAATAINSMIDTLQKAIEESNDVMNSVARGDFSKRITGEHKGDLDALKTAVNKSTESVEFSMHEIMSLVDALSRGDFSAKMDQAVDKNIRDRVEKSLLMMSQIISEVNSVLSYMAKGDYSHRVTSDASGELQALASNVNVRVQETDQALTEIAKVVGALAGGDLTQRVVHQYEGKFGEVATSLNGSIDNLSKLISDTTHGVGNLTGSVDQIHQGSQDLNDRTQRQAASLEETTATMDQIMHAVQGTTENAQSANQLASSARSQADDGAEVMRATIESMTDIKEASHKIEEIISLIDSIAFQTNLLALNAAVEAARAGEHGRGFAVVAGEVRNLAGKSADAARDIKSLIENAVEAVDQGTERAERSDEALQNIIESIRKVSDIVADISVASGEQATSIQQIGHAIGEIDNVTQQNAALVEESTAAAETMKDESGSLANLVSRFRV